MTARRSTDLTPSERAELPVNDRLDLLAVDLEEIRTDLAWILETLPRVLPPRPAR